MTGSFALVPLQPWLGWRHGGAGIASNLGWVFLGNLIGSVAYGVLLVIALTNAWSVAPAGVAARIVADRRSQDDRLRGHGHGRHGFRFREGHAMQLAGLPRRRDGDHLDSTLGKIVTAWLPILVFFAQGFEHPW